MSGVDWSDPTLIVGLHGVFHRHTWIDRVLVENDLEDEDVFSLAVSRAEAYGWSSTHLRSGPVDANCWGHNDAGGDWTEDGSVRQLAWLQVAVEEHLRGRRLPLLPVATVLDDVLHHMGTYGFTGLHAVVPTQSAGDGGLVHLSRAADWAVAAGPGPTAAGVITVAARDDAGLSKQAHSVRVLILERSFGRLAVHPAGPPVRAEGLAFPLAGEVQTEGMHEAVSLRCSLPAWSVDTAVWVAEVTTAAVRSVGVTQPVLLTVSRTRSDVRSEA